MEYGFTVSGNTLDWIQGRSFAIWFFHAALRKNEENGP